MAIPEVKFYNWDLGNGEVSSEAEPTTYYRPGVYDVSVELTLDDGSKMFLSELEYIICISENDNLFQDGYLTDPKSYHLGLDESITSGWSENSGEHWIWPESEAAISNQEIAGVGRLLVWDLFDDKQYYINTKNTPNTDIEYLDKGLYDISGFAILRAETAMSRSDIINHIETVVKYSEDIDSKSLSDGISLTLSLITNPYEDPVETVNIQNGVEASFTEFSQNKFPNSNMQQLKISTNKSEFNIEGTESLYKRSDESVVTTNMPNTTAEEFYSQGLHHWVSSPDYTKDKWINNFNYDIGTSSKVAGPIDGVSGLLLSQDLELNNTSGIAGSFFFMFEGTIPSIPSVTLIEYGEVGSYRFAYYNGAMPANITIPIGSTIFDIRISSQAITTDLIDAYTSNIKKFISRS